MSDLKTYIGTKTIKAQSMLRGAYLAYSGWDKHLSENLTDEGYLVEYPDSNSNHPNHEGYISWSPKEVFDKAYNCIEGYSVVGKLQAGAKESNVFVMPDKDYGGAHDYLAKACLGWDSDNNCSKFIDELIPVSFVKKEADGTLIGGLQNEQLLTILIDRMVKLNDKFPCDENVEQLRCLREALEWQESRTVARVSRGVMGNLEK